MNLRRPLAACCTALAAALLAGCAAIRAEHGVVESFDAQDRYARTVALPAEQACEAARLALLSQGYVITTRDREQLRGRKSFQLKGDSHAEVDVHVVCVAATEARAAAEGATVFVTAIQERYELKKASNSASVGIGVLGSLSLPFSTSNDSLVKVSSETLSSPRFYDRFFEVLERYLPEPTRMPEERVG